MLNHSSLTISSENRPIYSLKPTSKHGFSPVIRNSWSIWHQRTTCCCCQHVMLWSHAEPMASPKEYHKIEICMVANWSVEKKCTVFIWSFQGSGRRKDCGIVIKVTETRVWRVFENKSIFLSFEIKPYWYWRIPCYFFVWLACKKLCFKYHGLLDNILFF
jgi:hypothetical protein